MSLARIFQAQGQDEQAMTLAQQALAILEHVWPDHLQTAACLSYLATLWHQRGQEAQAQALEAQAQTIRARQSESS